MIFHPLEDVLAKYVLRFFISPFQEKSKIKNSSPINNNIKIRNKTVPLGATRMDLEIVSQKKKTNVI